MQAAEFVSVLDAAKSGAEWAWTRLYHWLAGSVQGYVRSRGAAEPEDVVGEVFVDVARSIHTFEGDAAAFRSWVFTIAHRRMIDERRRRGRRPVHVVGSLDDTEIAPDAASEAIDWLTEQEIRRIVGSLPDAQAEVMFLRIVAGFTIAEIAQVTGRRVGAVKSLQRRASRSLQKKLKEAVPLSDEPTITKMT